MNEMTHAYRYHYGVTYRYHLCLNREGFWMPETSWDTLGDTHFFTPKDGIKLSHGLPSNFKFNNLR